MLSTLAQRCHTVLTSGNISTLATEINNNYSSGNITYILGAKLTSELCKRKRVLWKDYSCNLTFPPVLGGGPFTAGFWDDSTTWNDLTSWND